ncbi:MAG TPA: hypothetical protein VGX28_12510 [Frankiaceae bacterium]|jgi:hypothetical protein|nr:hypothetical protein [Frankiaceae bacterium]
MKRSLSLKRESLTALTSGELGSVAGAAQAVTTPVTQCAPVRTLDVGECAAISDAHTCVDCLTRFC